MTRKITAIQVDYREWRDLIDGTGWPQGEWFKEPDRAQWIDGDTGYRCMINRVDFSGALNGYVLVSNTHPYFNKDYSRLDIDVHGGLTFSNDIDELPEEEESFKYLSWIMRPIDEPKPNWGFGFDCMHLHDYGPGMDRSLTRFQNPRNYKNWSYVEDEIIKLARQLKLAEEVKLLK